MDSRVLPYFQSRIAKVDLVAVLEESMATMSLLASQHLQRYKRALLQLGAGTASKKQLPIVQRAFSRDEAVDAAAKALASLWMNHGPLKTRRT
jgi:hypothetical protein